MTADWAARLPLFSYRAKAASDKWFPALSLSSRKLLSNTVPILHFSSLTFINIKGAARQPWRWGKVDDRGEAGGSRCHLVTTLMGSDQVRVTQARDRNEFAKSLHGSLPSTPPPPTPPPNSSSPLSPSIWVSAACSSERPHSTQFIGLNKATNTDTHTCT